MRSAPLKVWGLVLIGGLASACSGPRAGERAVARFPSSNLPAHGSEEQLSPAQREALERGEPVHRGRDLTLTRGRCPGTVSHQLVSARSSTIMAAFSRPNSLTELLPNTKRATLVDGDGRLARVELVQGNQWVDATYTVFMERISDRHLRFWLDHSRPRDIRDAWGYVRADPFDEDRSLLTVAVAVDIGPGLFSSLFAGAVQASILTTPGLIKRYTERLEIELRLREAERLSTLPPNHAVVERVAQAR